MNAFSHFSFPTSIVFGNRSITNLPELLKQLNAKRPLVVTDPGITKSNVLPQVIEALETKEQDSSWFIFSEVHPNPLESDVLSAAESFRKNNCDSIIALGGGSSLDVGKAVRLWIKKPELRLSEFNFEEDWTNLAPVICIPTTAGTGSEVGRSSVITDVVSKQKRVLFHPALLADHVILDPVLTQKLPSRLTAATGVDALTHCIESFTSPVLNPLCDGIALEGIHLIANALLPAFQNGDNLEARGKMLLAATMGGISFQKDLGVCHSLAHPLSSLLGMHHGTANALCLPAVMQWNAAKQPGLYRRIGVACSLDLSRSNDEESDTQTIGFVRDLLKSLELSSGLAAFGVEEKHVPTLAEQAFADSCHQTNPVPVTKEDLLELYKSAL